MSTVKGLVVGFLWGGIIAAVLTLVLSLATMTPRGQVVAGAEMPALPSQPDPSGGQDAPPTLAGGSPVGAPPDRSASEPSLPAELVAGLAVPPPESAAPNAQIAAETPTRPVDRPSLPDSVSMQHVPATDSETQACGRAGDFPTGHAVGF